MAKVDRKFGEYLQNAIEYIDEYTFSIYIMMHWEDEYYSKTVQTLIAWLNRKMVPGYQSRPEDTTGWDVDDLCQWFVLYNIDVSTQEIPSQFQEIYTAAMEGLRTDGTAKRRSPFKINPFASKRQLSQREIFLSAVECFNKQWDWKEITNPSTGYKSRGYWYDQALGSGLYYYTYFMKQTLNIMFGPQTHDKWPFPGQETPAWCAACEKAEEWEYTPIAADDFIFCFHNATLPTGTFTYSITLGVLGDPDSPTPGDPNVLTVRVGIQAINPEQEPTGPLTTQTFDPISEGWITPAYPFQAGANTTGFRLSITCNNGNGDYLIYFRNAKQKNFAGETIMLINGAEGDSFEWEVGAGDFSFKAYVSV